MIVRSFVLGVGLSGFLFVQQERGPVGDYHQHFFSPAISALSKTESIDASRLIALLDAAGIRRAVVFSLAYQFGNPNRPPIENEYERVKMENDWTSEQAARFPDRLRAFCSVNPRKEYAFEEIARCAKDPRLRLGLKMHFGNSDVDLTNAQHVARLEKIFDAANGHGMAIVVHLRSSISQKRPYGAASARTFIDRVLPAATRVPVQIAHLAGAGSYDEPVVDEAVGVFVDAIAKSDPRMERVYFDVSGVAGLGEWKQKSPLIARRIRELGVARILYGSDGAGGGNPTPQEAWSAFKQLPLSEEEFRAIETHVPPYMR